MRTVLNNLQQNNSFSKSNVSTGNTLTQVVRSSSLPLSDALLYPCTVLLTQRRPGMIRQVLKLLEAAVVQQVECGTCAAGAGGCCTHSTMQVTCALAVLNAQHYVRLGTAVTVQPCPEQPSGLSV
jgi:hypothetical protein